MELFEVGGAVRDGLLGLVATDHDWVAVGATPEALVALGYRPIGRDFPVLLHPQTGDEVALARTERKSAPGYHGFTFHAAPEVTLEQDLARRDLTINAMARAADGRLIDPFGGERDLRAGVLRHVSAAFVEDPVRLLRVARLAARFHTFTLAPETLALLQTMVAQGEVDALVAERVWQELSRGLMEARPSRLLAVLHETHALPRLLPSVQADAALCQRLDRCAQQGAALAVRFACLVFDANDASAIAERWRVPSECKELATLLMRELTQLQGAQGLEAEGLLSLLERCDALRRAARFDGLLQAAQCLAPASVDAQRLHAALLAAQAVDTASVAAHAATQGARGPAIGAAVFAARVAAIQACTALTPPTPRASSAH